MVGNNKNWHAKLMNKLQNLFMWFTFFVVLGVKTYRGKNVSPNTHTRKKMRILHSTKWTMIFTFVGTSTRSTLSTWEKRNLKKTEKKHSIQMTCTQLIKLLFFTQFFFGGYTKNELWNENERDEKWQLDFF